MYGKVGALCTWIVALLVLTRQGALIWLRSTAGTSKTKYTSHCIVKTFVVTYSVMISCDMLQTFLTLR